MKESGIVKEKISSKSGDKPSRLCNSGKFRFSTKVYRKPLLEGSFTRYIWTHLKLSNFNQSNIARSPWNGWRGGEMQPLVVPWWKWWMPNLLQQPDNDWKCAELRDHLTLCIGPTRCELTGSFRASGRGQWHVELCSGRALTVMLCNGSDQAQEKMLAMSDSEQTGQRSGRRGSRFFS